MFTGITRGTFPVTVLERRDDLLTYAVELPNSLREGLEPGASVAIDGVCQTVTRIEGDGVHFDAIRETLDKTTLGTLVTGDRVSVERSFRVGDEIGGHEVAGHVHGTGRIARTRSSDDTYDLEISVPTAWLKFIQPKGFIAIDGSSLTVGDVHPGAPESEEGSFWLHLIPETLRLTRLGEKVVGEEVNVELEARTVTIVRTVESVLERIVDEALAARLDRPTTSEAPSAEA